MKLKFRGQLLGQIKQCLKSENINERLVLLGDNFPMYGSHLQNSKKLLEYCSFNWEKVYVVPGTLELIGDGLKPISYNLDQLQDFLVVAPNKNVQLLNNSEVHDGDDMLVGSTFWCGAGVPGFMGRAATLKQLDNWAKEDAYFIGSMIKQATVQKKNLTIATYFLNDGLSDAAKQQLLNGLGGIGLPDNVDIKGRWFCGSHQRN